MKNKSFIVLVKHPVETTRNSSVCHMKTSLDYLPLTTIVMVILLLAKYDWEPDNLKIGLNMPRFTTPSSYCQLAQVLMIMLNSYNPY